MTSQLLTVVLALSAAQVIAQGPVPPVKTSPAPKSAKDTKVSVTVEGCIHGSRLTPDLSRHRADTIGIDFVNASDFALEGPREIIAQITKGHNGHQDEITGVAIIPATRQADGQLKSKRVSNKTTVTASATVDQDPHQEARRTIRLKVTSIRHLSEKCTIPG